MAVLALGAALSCTNAGLQPNETEVPDDLDNLLRITGDFCAQPDADIRFPVKVLLMIDNSTSLQCTDPGPADTLGDPSGRGVRGAAIERVINDVLAQEDAYIGVVSFSANIRSVGFTRDRAAINQVAYPGGLEPKTDYQGVLSTAISLLENDMLSVGSAELARTRYVVVMVSDGTPDPECNAGCEDDPNTCSNGEDDDGDGLVDAVDPDCADIDDADLHPDILSCLPGADVCICNLSRTQIEDALGDEADIAYVDFRGRCPAYNNYDTIVRRVEDLVALRDEYGVASITFNSVFLFTNQATAAANCTDTDGSLFGFNSARARSLLSAMAEAGEGVFRDVDVASGDTSFLSFSFLQLDAEQALQSIVAVSTNAVRAPLEAGGDPDVGGALLIDTEPDGAPDVDEAVIGLSTTNPDTEGDGYTDMFEMRFDGFDPVDANVPAVRCVSQTDLDGDGLRDCEESHLGTDPRDSDTDRDHITDGVEVRFGLDPTTNDVLQDADFDDIPNGDEVRGGTNPLSPDDGLYRRERIQYGLDDLGRFVVPGGSDERRCHRYDVRRVPLVTTPVVDNHGRNRVLIYAQEQPSNLGGAEVTTTVACFEAVYRGGQVKSPASGVIDVSAERWETLRESLQARFDALNASCQWFGGTAIDRGQLETSIQSCMPEVTEIDGFGYTFSDIRRLLRAYFASNGTPQMAAHPSDLFVPIETFDPDTDCHRPWELELLLEMLEEVRTVCGRCEEPAPSADDPDAPFYSPCCTAS